MRRLLISINNGAFNYYSKHIDIICQLELSGANDIIINIELFINRTLKEIIKVDSSNAAYEYQDEVITWVDKQVDLEVERLKTKAYLSL